LKVIQNLKDEEAADIAKRDECKDQYLSIESTVKDISWKIKKNEAKIDKLEKLIAQHEEEKFKTIEEIESVTAQMAAMTKQRNQENEAFLNAKTDDQAAIKLLEAAREVLTKYYKKNKIEMGPIQGSVKLLQKPFAVSEDQAPDATFSDKGSRKNESKGVVQLMTMLIEDLQDEIKNGMKDEEETQLEYEAEMKAAKKLKEELISKKVNLELTIAKRQEDKSDEHADMLKNQGEKTDELEYKAKIKPDCDWIIGSFKERETARAAEMNGLVTAKEYLAGAKVPSLLQKSKFNDDALSSIKFMAMK
jgi:ribosomal protein S15P/S13E